MEISGDTLLKFIKITVNVEFAQHEFCFRTLFKDCKMSKEHYAAQTEVHMAMFALLPFGTSIFSGSFSSKSWAVTIRSSRRLLAVGTTSGYRIKLL